MSVKITDPAVLRRIARVILAGRSEAPAVTGAPVATSSGAIQKVVSDA